MRKASEINILVACEESQAVTIEFRKLGFNAYSCDLQECSGGHPEWHIQDDVVKVMNDDWDVMIAFPPCTYLCFAGIRWNVNNIERQKKTESSIEFVRSIMNCDIDKIAVENPVGVITRYIRKFDQIIHPWMFGDGEMKRTCLWLKNLPKLVWANHDDLFIKKTSVGGRDQRIFKLPPSEDRAKLRSKTFPGIAKAMAEQWGKYLLDEK